MASQSKIRKSKGDHIWFRSGKELKNTNKLRGLYFYNSPLRRKIKKLSKEDLEDIDDFMNPFSFEEYCGNCDNFPGDEFGAKPSRFAYVECPFKGKINQYTKWKPLGCKCFDD